MLTWLLSLFRRRGRAEDLAIREEDAYARSYGDRSGEIVAVSRVPAPEPERIPRRTGDMSGELLRRAFEAKLDGRGKSSSSTAS